MRALAPAPLLFRLDPAEPPEAVCASVAAPEPVLDVEPARVFCSSTGVGDKKLTRGPDFRFFGGPNLPLAPPPASTDLRGSDHVFLSTVFRAPCPWMDGLTNGLDDRRTGSPPPPPLLLESGSAARDDGRSNFGRSIWCSSKAGGGMNGGLIGAMMLAGSVLIGAPMFKDGRLPGPPCAISPF